MTESIKERQNIITKTKRAKKYSHHDAHHGHICNRRMLQQHRFQLSRGHLIALDLDQFLRGNVSAPHPVCDVISFGSSNF